MAKQKRELRSVSTADLERVRGGGTLTTTSSPPPATAGHEQPIEIMSISFGPVRPS